MKGRIKSKLSRTLATVLMIAAAIFVSLSGNSMHSYADSGFSIQTSANPSTTDNVLQAVSAYDATHAWAVGSYRNTDGSLHDLIEYWNGTSWSVQTGAKQTLLPIFS